MFVSGNRLRQLLTIVMPACLSVPSPAASHQHVHGATMPLLALSAGRRRTADEDPAQYGVKISGKRPTSDLPDTLSKNTVMH